MKVLAIRGKNLASLAGEFEVDFMAEPLKSAGIFAITGPTGSGKSTLLDALCLALYDNAPRNSRATENIEITDVKENTTKHTINHTINQKDSRTILRRGAADGYAEVDFVSLGGETFRSRWSVRRSRDKVEGKLQSIDFRLTNLSANTEIQGRKTELLAKIVELVGLTFDQFTRAVLLAQGDFATFLKATQKEKAELLEKLTGTEVYSRISASIYQKSKTAEQNLALLNERIKGIELLSDDDLETITTEKQEIAKEMELLKSETAILTAKIKWIADSETLNNNIIQAERQLEDARNAVGQARERYDYLARIDSVGEVRGSYEELRSTERQLAENNDKLSRYEGDKSDNLKLLEQATKEVSACEAEQKAHLEFIAQIEPQIRLARELDIHIEGAKAKLKEATTEYEQTLKSKTKVETDIKATESAIKDVRQKQEKTKLWFKENEKYKEIVPRIELILNLLNDATASREQGKKNGETLAKNKLVLEGNKMKLADKEKERDRLNSLLPTEIATLRAKLAEGKPCPVCGSIHHPMGGIKGESLGEAKLNKAKEAINKEITELTNAIQNGMSENVRLQSVIESYTSQTNDAIGKLSAYLKDLPGWQTQFEDGILQNTLSAIAETWKEYTSEQSKRDEMTAYLQNKLKLGQERLDEAVQALAEKGQKLKNCEGDLSKLKDERGGLLSGKSTEDIEKEYKDKTEEISHRLAGLTKKKGDITSKGDKIAGNISQISKFNEELRERNSAADTIIRQWIADKDGTITFETLADLFAKDNRWVTTERGTLNRLKEGVTTAQATLAERHKNLDKHREAEIKPTGDETKEDLQTLLSNKILEQDVKSKRNTEIEIALTNHAQGKVKLKAFEKELEEKRTLSENWKKLNDMLGSADGSKFKVLAQGYTLDALLAFANKHLQELSKRYELQRIGDTLALQVVDLDMLGEVRSVHSLSGGESFLISLALALGLSSLSSNRMKVESLFIDEGFGSLDIDTLRVAMDALESLQTQGRKIGVISHVAEMTERITTQINVVKSANGKSSIDIM